MSGGTQNVKKLKPSSHNTGLKKCMNSRGNPPDVMNDECEEIMLSEVEKAIKDLKDKKASGEDEITAEM